MPDDLYGGWAGFETAPMTRGAIACGNPDAAEAGAEVYRAGGNAIDACVAAAFAMGVVEPLDSGLGAGGFMVLHHASTNTTACLDFMGTAPASARYEIFPAVDPTGDYAIKVKGRANEDAHTSVAVPGAAAGLCRALERFGVLDRQAVMAPAIRLGREGFTVAAKSALRMQRSERLPFVEFIPVDNRIAAISVKLPPHHADPADRIIAATALVQRVPLASVDRMLRLYKELDFIC